MLRIVLAILAAGMCLVIHETGHYAVARYLGYRLRFRFAWGRLGGVLVPRCIWDMPPEATEEHRRAIAQAGFWSEILWAISCVSASPWGLVTAGVALIHLGLYPWYAGTESDFRWLK